jgi:hypothetical protein
MSLHPTYNRRSSTGIPASLPLSTIGKLSSQLHRTLVTACYLKWYGNLYVGIGGQHTRRGANRRAATESNGRTRLQGLRSITTLVALLIVLVTDGLEDTRNQSSDTHLGRAELCARGHFYGRIDCPFGLRPPDARSSPVHHGYNPKRFVLMNPDRL